MSIFNKTVSWAIIDKSSDENVSIVTGLLIHHLKFFFVLTVEELYNETLLRNRSVV